MLKSRYLRGNTRSSICELRTITFGLCITAALFFWFSQSRINAGDQQQQPILTNIGAIAKTNEYKTKDDATRTRYSDRVWVGKRFAPHDLKEECINTEEGVRGYLKKDALLTLIVLPKDLGSDQKNSGGELHLRHLMYGWSNLPYINFLIMSSSCGVLELADEYGLPTVKKSSGSDVGDLTYRHLLRVVNDMSDTPFVGYVNSDIVFDEGLPETIAAAVKYVQTSGNRKDMTLIGYRFNSDVPNELFAPNGQEIRPNVWTNIVQHMKTKNVRFMHQAQDYFIFTRNGPLKIDDLPSFFVGGVAFDNFLSQIFWRMDNHDGKSVTVDATATLKAYHINHGGKTRSRKKLKLSHLSVGSDFNRKIMKDFEFVKGEGKYMTDHMTVTSRDTQGNIVFVPRPPER